MSNELTTDVEDEMPQTRREVEKALRAAMKEINFRQKKYVRGLSNGMSQEKAALTAGYAENTAKKMPHQILGNVGVRRCLDLQQRLDELNHGIEAKTIRDGLLEVAEMTKTPGDTFQPAASVRAYRTLGELDGHLGRDRVNVLGSGVQIVINTGVPERIEQVIDAEVIDSHD